jgi:threonine aldolase
MMESFNRRNFLKLSGLSSLPVILPSLPVQANEKSSPVLSDADSVYFINEGPFYKPSELISLLQQINSKKEIGRDAYGQGGALEELTKKMAAITGKEAAVYIPTGTLANQLAISVLSGENSKVFVQETSHVYRDEADAAQTLFNKRLIPLAKGKAFFTAEELKEAVEYHNNEEVFKAGMGAVSIEVPVRRCDNAHFPLAEIKKIATYCRQQHLKLHLDGARLHLDSAYTGVSVREYADLFDTVYMCLYKYLGATGGAVLCGEKAVIGKMDHLIKIHGGSIFTSWTNAAIALHNLEGLEDRLKQMATQSIALIRELNQIPELKITTIDGGTNVFQLKLSDKVDLAKMKDSLRRKHFIVLGVLSENGIIKFRINETLLKRGNSDYVAAFKDAIASARV